MLAYDLRTDGRTCPLTVTSEAPILSWRLAPGASDSPRAVVEVADSPGAILDPTADKWTSALLPIGVNNLQWNAGLASRQRRFWRVGIVHAPDSAPAWSEPTWFEAPLLKGSDWIADWVTHPSWLPGLTIPEALPVLEKRIVLADRPTRARLYIAGAGVLQVHINGAKANVAELAPGYSTVQKRVGAVAWDVLPALRAGENCLEISLGTGMSFVPRIEGRYTKLSSDDLRPRALAQLELLFTDGSRQIIATDASWTARLGGTTVAHWYGGEDYDARRTGEPTPVAVIGAPGLHPLWWPEYPQLRVQDRLAPVSCVRLSGGRRIIDFGVNVAGRARLRLSQPPTGMIVRLWPAEALDERGRVTQWSTGGPTWDQYIAGGNPGIEDWAPSFVYHGFRYLEVEGLRDEDPDDCITAEVIYADNRGVGQFSSSDLVLDRLHTVIDRSIKGNMYSVFTDCPHREKLGWIEQLWLCFDALARNYDVDAHLRDALQHMWDSQLPNGALTNIAPESVDFSGFEYLGDPNAFREDPNWGGALVHVPWRLYETYGDARAMREGWEPIRRYLDYLHQRADAGILDFGLGDWIGLDQSTPRSMVATFGYYRILESARRIAGALNEATAAAVLEQRSAEVLEGFTRSFSSSGGLEWGNGNQASLALALDLGVVPGVHERAVAERLAALIVDAGDRLTLGEVSLPSLLRVLSSTGRDDLIARVVRNTDVPGYGYQIARGATSLAETWSGNAGPEGEGSQNHFMLGMVHNWLHGSLAGITQQEGSIGWERIHIRPTWLEDVDSLHSSFESPRGLVAVRWGGSPLREVEITVPPGSTALVDVAEPASIRVVADDGAEGEPVENGARRRFAVGAGTWRFGQGRL